MVVKERQRKKKQMVVKTGHNDNQNHKYLVSSIGEPFLYII
jgi:hypothetical protein